MVGDFNSEWWANSSRNRGRHHPEFAADGSGAGLIGAGVVGLVAGAASFGILALLFATLRAPILRIAVALIFAAPAAVAGYALVHGVTDGAVPSPVWRQVLCLSGSGFVGLSAFLRLAASTSSRGG
ncbi:MAG: hypothetical protein AB7F78_18240 [Hyphomicrobiaceae bacterium]